MDNTELRKLRLSLTLTQEQMAEKIGISHSAIVKLEAGKNKMSKPVAMLCQQLENHHLVVQNP